MVLDGALVAAAALAALLAVRSCRGDAAAMPDEARSERQLVVVETATRRMRLYEEGRLAAEYDVVLGQVGGCKQRRDDRKTPCGKYFVVDKHRVPVDGPSAESAAMFGGYWIRLNYPGDNDAARGLADGLIDAGTHDAILMAWKNRRPTAADTPLGSGIGIHSFPEDWDANVADEQRPFSWGCVVMHPGDISAFFERVRAGTMVLLR
jgi:hypothetical protein